MEALSAVLYLAEDAVAVVSLCVILRYIFLKRPRFSPTAAVLLCAAAAVNAGAGVYLAGVHEFFLGLTNMISFCLRTAAAYIFFTDRRQGKTLLTVLIYDATVDMLCSLLAPYISGAPWAESLVCLLLHAFFAAFFWFTARRSAVNFLPQVFGQIPKWIYVSLLLFEETCYYKEFGEAAAWYRAFYIVSSAAVVLCVLYLVFKIFWLAYRQNLIIEQMELQKTYGETLQNNDEELRRFRHDYKNHIIVVNALLAAGRTDEARDYMNSMNAAVDGAIQRLSSGNFVADAILNHKAVAAKKHGIRIAFSGKIPEYGVRNEDLCTVLSNLLDNAVEATEKLPPGDKEIAVEAGMHGQTFFLNVSNPTQQTKINIGQTTKADKRNHGIGLQNVKRVVNAYRGALVTESKDGVFTAEIIMQLDDAKS